MTRDPRWNAPHMDPSLGVAYDLDELESQPRVAAGDWLTLNDGARVVLRRRPAEEVASELRMLVKDQPLPELLFFKHGGRWHIGAINGRSVVGLAPLVNSEREVIERLAREFGYR